MLEDRAYNRQNLVFIVRASYTKDLLLGHTKKLDISF